MRLILLCLFVAAATCQKLKSLPKGNAFHTPDPSTLDGKVVFGYQGWYATPPSSPSWTHWFDSRNTSTVFCELEKMQHDLMLIYMQLTVIIGLIPLSIHLSVWRTALLFGQTDPLLRESGYLSFILQSLNDPDCTTICALVL